MKKHFFFKKIKNPPRAGKQATGKKATTRRGYEGKSYNPTGLRRQTVPKATKATTRRGYEGSSYNPTGLRRQPGYDWDPKTYNPTGLRPKKLQPDGATMADGPKIDPGGLQRAHQVEHIRD